MPENPDVDAWMASYDNPMKPVVQRVREILLAADERLQECIKWKSPTFTFKGNLASFNPRSKQHASLMFHTGAQIPGTYSRLEGGGATARFMKLRSVKEANLAKAELQELVAAWIQLRNGKPKTASKKKAAPKKRTAGR